MISSVDRFASARRRRRERYGRMAVAVGAVVVVGLGATWLGRPLVLLNTTSSEPVGLYLASPNRLCVGQIVAFRAPPAAFPYADARLAYLHRTPMLKAIAAAVGDHVCTVAGRLRINGWDRSPVVARDSRGARLPHWLGCRRLTSGEVFVFSDHVPNSFDSRYFGPVSTRAILGTYRPLLIHSGAS